MSPFTRPQDGAAPYRVLYGDRDADFAAFLRERLEREDDKLDVETTGALGDLLAATDREIDCLLVGSRLEATGPVAILKAVRERDVDIPVVLFTSRGTESLASDAISAGVTDYIVRESGSEQYQLLSQRLVSVAESYRTEQRATAATDRLEQIYDRIDDAFYAVDDDWQVTYWNERMADRTDVPAEEIVGEVVWDVFPEMVDSEPHEKYQQAMATQEPVTFETYVEPLEYWTEVRVFPDESGLSIYSREITERKTQQQQLAELKDRLDLAISGANLGVWDWNIRTDDVTFNEQWATMLGFSLEEIDQSLDAWEQRVHPDDMPRVEEQLQAHLEGETERYDCEHRVETKSGDYKWVRDVGEVVERDADGEPRRAVGIHIDVTEQREEQERRQERLERLHTLHEADRELTVAETTAEIGRTAVEAADEILDLPATCVWQHDDGALVPVAVSETGQATVESVPTFEPGNSIAWEVFERGEARIIEDIRATEQAYNPESPLRSEIIAPLGEHGVMSAGSTQVDSYDDIDAELFQILANSVKASMTRADREARLREREQELTRENERLDDFTSVVAHDLRNPLAIAVGMLDVARQTREEEHFQKADDALFRMEELIEDLLTLAQYGQAVDETSAVPLEQMAHESWGYVETGDADLVVEAAPDETVDADRDRLSQLLENLFRNAVEHGGEDVAVRVGLLNGGFYVEDTGEGIPTDQRDAVLEHGFTTNQDGTGFGLSIVTDIATAHGWEPTVTASDEGGARFEFVATD